MISNQHYIELYINKELIELKSQDSLNLRVNNVLFNPTKTTTTQSEFSYSFDIPSTPNNDRILNFANNLSKLNKFHARYPSQVYADGELIYDGSLTIQKYSSKTRMYTCNLVNIKVNTLEDIFGEEVLTDLHWDVPFSGAPTINQINWDYSTKYYFPLVSYGVFQKDYVTKDEVAATYTPKHNLDKYNKWWIESFYPSLNMLEIAKRAFESKGYSVNGSAFYDQNIANIFCSTNLASEQAPIYNLGNPKFGDLHLSVGWNNYNSINSRSGFNRDENIFRNGTGGISQDLKFPYYKVEPAINAINSTSPEEYNYSTINWWNMMDKKNNSASTVTIHNDTYMLDPGEMVIVIPADGWYRIDLSTNVYLKDPGTTFEAEQWTTTYYEDDEFKKRQITLKRGLKEITPVEIQLIRNYDDNIELIKGNWNVEYKTGNPNDETYTYKGGTYTGGTYENRSEWRTDFPHQDLYGSTRPTKLNELNITSTGNTRGGGWVNGSSTGGGTFGGNNLAHAHVGERIGASSTNTQGYMHRNGFVMPYDQAVSTAFICGFSSMGDATVSVMRNGRSWSNLSSVNNNIFADVKGMDIVNLEGNGTSTVPTDYCANTYKQSPSNYCFSTENTMNGSATCCVYLSKNDILELVAIQRDFDGQAYATSANCELHITAISEKSQEALRADPYFGYYSETEFPVNLNLFNFTNKETKISDWLSNIQKAFNLEYVMDGNNVDINTNKGIRKDINYAIDIDDRVNSSEAESEFISYPREMSVQYKIDTEEWGFELTVPPEHINDEDWAKWGDSGFTIIKLNDDSYETSTQNTSVQFSYTYYDNFLWKEVLENGTETDYSGLTITIPVIEKSEYMAEGYGYEEAMKHDGYSMTQRFWYRDQVGQEYVYLSSVLASGRKEYIDLTYPINSYNRFNLSYKDSETSIATQYFNIHPMLSSNYINVDAYLTPKEYKELKGGALIKFDSDLYYVSELKGYDPSGGNTTELKLIKKT